ncbi:hypothetical protein [Mesorhizobium marinum]|uniref:hypothetical protein n=1 Tax=Mesorhizobium marinum TaxID=3228790 RepID=UPI00346515E8
MIKVVGHGGSADARRLVAAALRRSVGHGQVGLQSRTEPLDAGIAAFVDPGEGNGDIMRSWLAGGPRKLIVFGRPPSFLRELLGASLKPRNGATAFDGAAQAAPVHEFRESPAFVQYGPLARRLGGNAWRRPLQRFDYADEWNNLGYGSIASGQTIWGLGEVTDVPPDIELAALMAAPGRKVGSYAALLDQPDSSTLWFNRPVGPIDSFEWRLVEMFLSSHRADELPAQPVLSEIPFGHDAVVTMRLDCDEDIESARRLWLAYRQWGVPLSLAVKTALLDGEFPLLADVLSGGGSILSHSATHMANWGGSYAAALEEALSSATRLEQVTGRRPRYAVSPFHQTPGYALQALHAAGYEGCVGGNVGGDPAFNLARGGSLAGLPRGFVGQSQQCMLHGDCMLPGGDPLATYRQAFDTALETRSIFAYTDHPFSARYSYGWSNEDARIEAHRKLLDHIAATAKSPLYLGMEAVLDFLAANARTEVVAKDGGFAFGLDNGDKRGACVEYRGKLVEIFDGMHLR